MTTTTAVESLPQLPKTTEEFAALAPEKKAIRFGRLFRAVGNKEQIHWDRATKKAALATLERKEADLHREVARLQGVMDGKNAFARSGRSTATTAKPVKVTKFLQGLQPRMARLGEDLVRARFVRRVLTEASK